MVEPCLSLIIKQKLRLKDPENDNMAHDVFISYSREDQVIADAVCAILEQKKIRCWIDHRDIHAGANWRAKINQAINKCKIMVFIHSSHSKNSEDVTREIVLASRNGKTIIPFRIEEVGYNDTVQFELQGKGINWIDALNPTCEKSIKKLAEDISNLLNKKHANYLDDSEYHFRIKESDCKSLIPSNECKKCKELIPKGEELCEDCKLDKPKPTPRSNSQSIFQKLLTKKIGIPILIGLIILISLIAVLGGPYFNSSTTSSGISIIDPTNGQSVPMSTVVKGTAKLASNQNIYLLIQPQSLNNDGPYDWWVYETNINSDGSWESNVQIGLDNDTSRKFRICAIITEEKLEIGDYGPNLPKYKEKSEISVERE